jgi:hypothetical protein
LACQSAFLPIGPALVQIQHAGNGFALSRPTIKDIFCMFEKWNYRSF